MFARESEAARVPLRLCIVRPVHLKSTGLVSRFASLAWECRGSRLIGLSIKIYL